MSGLAMIKFDFTNKEDEAAFGPIFVTGLNPREDRPGRFMDNALVVLEENAAKVVEAFNAEYKGSMEFTLPPLEPWLPLDGKVCFGKFKAVKYFPPRIEE